MSLRGSPDGGGERAGRAVPAERLVSTHVAYDDRSDRITVSPAGVDDIERMATWLTADADAFVDLAGVR